MAIIVYRRRLTVTGGADRAGRDVEGIAGIREPFNQIAQIAQIAAVERGGCRLLQLTGSQI